jgi:hypothetical protein
MSVDPMDHESPAERRARIFVRQRSRRRLVFGIVGAVVLVGGGAIYGGYRLMSHAPATTTADVPLVHADDQPTRKKPAEPGGMAVPDQDSLVLNRSEPKTEKLLPPPETPLPRPAPAEKPPAADATPAPAPAASPPPTPPPAPPKVAATQPPAAAPPAPAPPAPAPSKPKVAALPPPPAAPPAAAGKGFRLQRGAVRTPQAANQEWARLRQQNQDMLGRLAMNPVRVDLGDRGIFYRIQAGPLADAATAERACNELKRRGVGCLLVKP